MVYLIGGAPRIGKSTQARQFAQHIGARLVSTDELESPNADPPVLFYSDPKRNILSPDKRLSAVIDEAKQISTVVSDIISKAVNKAEDIVIEGVHLFPSYIADCVARFGRQNIKAIFIGSRNPELILQGMAQNTSPDNWLINFNQEVRGQIALFTKTFSDYLFEECFKYSFLYLERSADFERDILDIHHFLTATDIAAKNNTTSR